jgi:hypothetical protein
MLAWHDKYSAVRAACLALHRDFNAFVRACEKYGRKNLQQITQVGWG